LYSIWARNITAEFYKQGDVERAHGMPLSRFMDRNIDLRSDSQIGFITHVVKPSYAMLARLSPELSVVVNKNLSHNLSLMQLKADEKVGQKVPPSGPGNPEVVHVLSTIAASPTSTDAQHAQTTGH